MSCACFRGLAADWYDVFSNHFRVSKQCRQWFADTVLFAHPERFSEYLLECPSTEVSSSISLPAMVRLPIP